MSPEPASHNICYATLTSASRCAPTTWRRTDGATAQLASLGSQPDSQRFASPARQASRLDPHPPSCANGRGHTSLYNPTSRKNLSADICIRYALHIRDIYALRLSGNAVGGRGQFLNPKKIFDLRCGNE